MSKKQSNPPPSGDRPNPPPAPPPKHEAEECAEPSWPEQILIELRAMNEKLDFLVGYQVIDHGDDEEEVPETYLSGEPV